MIYVVFDTNIIVSAFLKRASIPNMALKTIKSDYVIPIFTEKILAEYRDVLSREKFHFSEQIIEELFEDLSTVGQYIVPQPVDVDLPDPKDRPFLECLKGAQNKGLDAYLITGNGKHFPDDLRILTPREYLNLFLN